MECIHENSEQECRSIGSVLTKTSRAFVEVVIYDRPFFCEQSRTYSCTPFCEWLAAI